MPHTADPHGCARIWLLGFLGGCIYVMFLLTPYGTCSEVFRASAPNKCCCCHKPCNREWSDWSLFPSWGLKLRAWTRQQRWARMKNECMKHTVKTACELLMKGWIRSVQEAFALALAEDPSGPVWSSHQSNAQEKSGSSQSLFRFNSKRWVSILQQGFRVSRVSLTTKLTLTWFGKQLSSQGPRR